jgi:hypothetical protein
MILTVWSVGGMILTVWSVGGMILTGETEGLGGKLVTVPLFP